RAMRSAKRENAALRIAGNILAAKIAFARGDTAGAEVFLRRGAREEDAFPYTEPPGWWLPAREALGMVLLAEKDFKGAAKAFRGELARHPGNGRALYGLRECARATGDARLAEKYDAELRQAWKQADTKSAMAWF